MLTKIFGDTRITDKKQKSTIPNLVVWTKRSSCGKASKTAPQPGTLVLSLFLTLPRSSKLVIGEGQQCLSIIPNVTGCRTAVSSLDLQVAS